MPHLRSIFLSLMACLLFVPAFGQKGQLAIGFEFQAYPTGLIPGVRLALGLGDQDELHLRLGYNFIRHRDLGVHEDERGNGFGFTLGYRHYFSPELKGWFLGLRDDTWFNTIDWRDNIGQTNEISGRTNIVVVQPTAEGGYLFETKDGNWTIAPALGFGFEINVVSNGADVGQGAILLVGFTLSRRGK